MKTRTRRILWALALLLLAAELVFVNLPEKKAPLGAQPGERLPDFTALCTDGSEFRLSEQRGKVVVINLWATWCTPCVRELPHFDALLRERPEELAVLAVHTPPVTSDVGAYLAEFSYTMPFTVDEEGSLSEGWDVSTVLPQTLILDREGVVTYNQPGALSEEELAALVDEALR